MTKLYFFIKRVVQTLYAVMAYLVIIILCFPFSIVGILGNFWTTLRMTAVCKKIIKQTTILFGSLPLSNEEYIAAQINKALKVPE